MKHPFYSSQVSRFAALVVADALFFGLTDPANVPSFALIIGFLLFAATLYQLVKGIFKLGAWYGISYTKHQLRLARIVTGVLAGTIALQSMGQLVGRDILVLIPLLLVVYLYLSYGKPIAQPVRVEE